MLQEEDPINPDNLMRQSHSIVKKERRRKEGRCLRGETREAEEEEEDAPDAATRSGEVGTITSPNTGRFDVLLTPAILALFHCMVYCTV